jgi:hypothetical protein
MVIKATVNRNYERIPRKYSTATNITLRIELDRRGVTTTR